MKIWSSRSPSTRGTPSTRLWECYERWVNETGATRLDRKTFAHRLEARGLKRGRVSHARTRDVTEDAEDADIQQPRVLSPTERRRERLRAWRAANREHLREYKRRWPFPATGVLTLPVDPNAVWSVPTACRSLPRLLVIRGSGDCQRRHRYPATALKRKRSLLFIGRVHNRNALGFLKGSHNDLQICRMLPRKPMPDTFTAARGDLIKRLIPRPPMDVSSLRSSLATMVASQWQRHVLPILGDAPLGSGPQRAAKVRFMAEMYARACYSMLT